MHFHETSSIIFPTSSNINNHHQLMTSTINKDFQLSLSISNINDHQETSTAENVNKHIILDLIEYHQSWSNIIMHNQEVPNVIKHQQTSTGISENDQHHQTYQPTPQEAFFFSASTNIFANTCKRYHIRSNTINFYHRSSTVQKLLCLVWLVVGSRVFVSVPQADDASERGSSLYSEVVKSFTFLTTVGLGGGFKHFLFSHLFGEMIQFD